MSQNGFGGGAAAAGGEGRKVDFDAFAFSDLLVRGLHGYSWTQLEKLVRSGSGKVQDATLKGEPGPPCVA